MNETDKILKEMIDHIGTYYIGSAPVTWGDLRDFLNGRIKGKNENCNACNKLISMEEFDQGMGDCLDCFPL